MENRPRFKNGKVDATGENIEIVDEAHSPEIQSELGKNSGSGENGNGKDLEREKLDQELLRIEPTESDNKLISTRNVTNEGIGGGKTGNESTGNMIVKENEGGNKTNEEEPEEDGSGDQGNQGGETDQNIVGHLVVGSNEESVSKGDLVDGSATGNVGIGKQ